MKQIKLLGEIGPLTKKGLKGWCKAEEDDSPREISCSIGREKLGVYVANDVRKKLSNKGFEGIRYGFNIPLDLESVGLARLDVQDVSTGLPLPGSPTLIGSNAALFFMHIPKTAGTSFRSMLKALFQESSIYPNIKDIRENGGLYPEIRALYELSNERIANLRLINGHYPLALVDGWFFPTRTVTFFRQPEERVISHIRHLKKNDNACKALTFEEIYARHKGSLVNLQLRMMKNSEYKQLGELTLESTRFNHEKLVKTLERFLAFGLVEAFEDSMHWIGRELGLAMPKTVFTNQASLKEPFSIELLSAIKNDCKLECEAYEVIKSVFYLRCKPENQVGQYGS